MFFQTLIDSKHKNFNSDSINNNSLETDALFSF